MQIKMNDVSVRSPFVVVAPTIKSPLRTLNLNRKYDVSGIFSYIFFVFLYLVWLSSARMM